MKLREEFYELFKNASKSDIKKAISLLSESDKDLLIYLWGQDKKQRKMNTKQVEDLIKNVKKSLSTLKLDFTPTILNVITDKNYNVKNPPLLVINDNVISEGKVLTEREISKYIKEYAI